MNIIFVSRLFDSNDNPFTQIISSIPPVSIAAIANSNILDKSNTSHGTYVIDTTIDKNIAVKEIENYLNSNQNTNNYSTKVCKGGTIIFEW